MIAALGTLRTGVRGDVSDMAQSAAQSGHGNKACCFAGWCGKSINRWEDASEGFLQTNRNFVQGSHDIEAVQASRQAAQRGRSEDIVPAYQALRPEAQAAFRGGYVDPLIAQTRGVAFGFNKARPFLSPLKPTRWRRQPAICSVIFANRRCSKPATRRRTAPGRCCRSQTG